MIGGQELLDHINMAMAQNKCTKRRKVNHLEAGKAVTGSPAHDYTATLRSRCQPKPELEKGKKRMEKIIAELTVK